MAACSLASMPSISGAIVSSTLRTALLHALAAVALAVAVAQLDRLALAGGGARGHRGPAPGAGLQLDLDLDGGIAARVEDLATRRRR